MDFELDRTIINLNNGFTCPTSRAALESEIRYLHMINMSPIFYQRWLCRPRADHPLADGGGIWM